nr:signal peptidase II [Hoyosella rhizosphaerae]
MGVRTEPTDTTTVHPRRVQLLFAVAFVALALDVVTKVLAVAYLEGREPIRTLGGAVYLTLHRNPGAAFSFATELTWLLSAIAAIVVIGVVLFSVRVRSLPWAIGLGLILGGALGNLSDRIFREPGIMQGHVVDFISLFAPDGSVWPVFNIADPAIVGGAIFLVLLTFLGYEPNGTRYQGKKTTSDSVNDGEETRP